MCIAEGNFSGVQIEANAIELRTLLCVLLPCWQHHQNFKPRKRFWTPNSKSWKMMDAFISLSFFYRQHKNQIWEGHLRLRLVEVIIIHISVLHFDQINYSSKECHNLWLWSPPIWSICIDLSSCRTWTIWLDVWERSTVKSQGQVLHRQL